jgi:hypothetical protein
MVVLALLVGDGADAERYLVNAAAGNDGDSHVDDDDPDAYAEFQRVQKGGGAEFYQASADASAGGLFASASRVDPLPPAAISTRSAATIEETIHFDELPADSVSVTATLGVAVTASSNVGFANASARLDLGACYVTRGYNAGSGPSASTNCPGLADPGTGTITLQVTRDQLIASGGELDILVSVSAQLETLGGIDGEAHAGGGFSRGDQPVPGRVYLQLDPPLAHHFTGSMTAFPVPEPGAPLLLAAGGGVLLAARRRRAR